MIRRRVRLIAARTGRSAVGGRDTEVGAIKLFTGIGSHGELAEVTVDLLLVLAGSARDLDLVLNDNVVAKLCRREGLAAAGPEWALDRGVRVQRENLTAHVLRACICTAVRVELLLGRKLGVHYA